MENLHQSFCYQRGQTAQLVRTGRQTWHKKNKSWSTNNSCSYEELCPPGSHRSRGREVYQRLPAVGPRKDILLICYDDSQLSVAGVQKQVRPRRKDLNLYEEYKRSRTLRGRNTNRGRTTNRRRELEQTLPQALLADLVRERREKTRLRVARWRAKRKLQACLMASQAVQFSGAPVQSSPAQRGGLISTRRRGGATAQRGGLGMRRGLSETGTYNLLLQLGPSPNQAAATRGMNEGLMPSGSSPLSQHRTTAPRPTYQ